MPLWEFAQGGGRRAAHRPPGDAGAGHRLRHPAVHLPPLLLRHLLLLQPARAVPRHGGRVHRGGVARPADAARQRGLGAAAPVGEHRAEQRQDLVRGTSRAHHRRDRDQHRFLPHRLARGLRHPDLALELVDREDGRVLQRHHGECGLGVQARLRVLRARRPRAALHAGAPVLALGHGPPRAEGDGRLVASREELGDGRGGPRAARHLPAGWAVGCEGLAPAPETRGDSGPGAAAACAERGLAGEG
mmetsp:Transcript_63278/g.177022  ORF Transcript_63278/g.177022 Transcript_63278/m.177022 type:complete len:246 (-) Transcript_63278:271-1008(-)